MAAVLDECLAVRAAADAEVNRGIRVSRFEVLQRTLARLKDFEGELLLATAPEGHMEPEWSAQVYGFRAKCTRGHVGASLTIPRIVHLCVTCLRSLCVVLWSISSGEVTS